MRNRTIIVVLIAVLVVVVGYERGWFSLKTTHQVGSSNVDVNLKLNAEKVKSDASDLTHSK
jgi:hypothetical protein